MSLIRTFAAVAGAALLLTAPALAAPYLGPEIPDKVTLNSSVTVAGPPVRLSDLFAGLVRDQDKVVAPAPRPGQRAVLPADFLATVARTYNVDWHPADTYDRVVLFRPGQTVSPTDIMTTLEADMFLKGMP